MAERDIRSADIQLVGVVQPHALSSVSVGFLTQLGKPPNRPDVHDCWLAASNRQAFQKEIGNAIEFFEEVFSHDMTGCRLIILLADIACRHHTVLLGRLALLKS